MNDIAIEKDNREDLSLECQLCRNTFVFSAQEQRFYLEMGFVTPRYCPNCRKARKHDALALKNEEWKDFYEIVCYRCGKKTTVPFKPVNGRPVYCRECLEEIHKEENTIVFNEEKLSSSKAPMAANVPGIGITRVEDAERPYSELEEVVDSLLKRLYK